MTPTVQTFAVSWPLSGDATSTIGIVGEGELARFIATRAFRFGIEVLAGVNYAGEEWHSLADVSGGRLRLLTPLEAIRPEIVVLAVPWASVASTLSLVVDWEARILVDATTPEEPIGGNGVAAVENSTQLLASMVQNAYVVKGLNFAPGKFEMQIGSDFGRRVAFISGDEPRANSEVCRLLGQMGFAAVDLGPLAQGAPLQRVPGPLSDCIMMRLD
ncbi:putative dinucleotide-binding enzyme [Rhizobium tibeticum]|uniref:NADPH-dependent F420 reductase n=1 Tax=Rhizobium tibeticum TaxID=501024 RepID=UPI00277F170B|nr:NAD(P)-binding domain-containing protein [Rhizobium tibeticum]MDP9810030.1 putative dinucleotide-binding enzyme [Rhizobium tibeticum]